MEERQVEVIKKVEGPVIRDRRLVGKPLTITRKRVAAYVRVSTNAEEQLQSFKSQKEYYQDKISANKECACRHLCGRGYYGNKDHQER